MRTVLSAALFASLLVACSDSGTTVIMHVHSDAPTYGDVPFPTDALREGNHLGTLKGLDTFLTRQTDIVAQHLAALDGYGLRPLVELATTGPIDPDTLAAGASLVDVDPDSPERGRVFDMEWHFDVDRNVIGGRLASGQILREGTRYAAYVTNAVRDASGAPLSRAGALDDLRGGPPARWKTTADALRDVDTKHDVVALAVFTTQHASAPLLAAREQIAVLPPSPLTFDNPAVVFSGTAQLDRVLGISTRASDGPRTGLERWGNDNPTGIAHDHVGVLGTGHMQIARFRRDDSGTDDPSDETFSDPPSIVAMDTIPVTFILPASAMPPGGYPIVIYGHGLGASRDQLLSFAEPLTSKGYAIVGIDMSGHGSRYMPADVIANMAGQLQNFNGEVSLPDGFGDTTGIATQFDFFEGFLNVSAVRDSIRQSALDLCRVTQMLRRTDLDLSALAGPGTSAPKLDTTRIAYLGESFGTVVGTVFASIEPNIHLFVLDVPGGGILDTLLPDSAEIGSLAMPLIQGIYGPTQALDRWNPLIALMQSVVDGADPLTYAPHVMADRFTIAGEPMPPRSVVALEVYGDQVLSNEGTDALAQELHLDVLTPDLAPPTGLTEIASPAAGNRDGAITAVMVQYAPASHGANWSAEHGILRYQPGFPFDGDDRFPRLDAPIKIKEPIYETQAQVAEILESYFAGEAPRVRSTLAPMPDFDGDGRMDAVDPDPFNPAI